MIDHGKHNVLGVGIDAVDYAAAVARITAAAHDRRPLAVSALAVHGVMTGVFDRRHRYRLNQLDLVCPDGQPVRWALRLLHGARLPDRVYGPRLMLETCAAAAREGLPIFLFGGDADLLAALCEQLRSRFPDLNIAGARPSKFRTLSGDEWTDLAREVEASGARLMFVGLGCPRQEVFAYEFRDAAPLPTLAVGAAFAFIAGRLPQAPPVMQRWGLEWLYRLAHEPRRLWRRYALLNPAYVALLTLQKIGLRRVEFTHNELPPAPLLYG
jgi:N-acetylglucosaminyldiphosphoundecaprenol N-acetyl-beta-D-mannosaminyltransferase